MNGRDVIVEGLIESINDMLVIIEEQEIIEPEFAVAKGIADDLREEIRALQGD